MNKLLERSINARNEEAILKLARREDLIRWSKNPAELSKEDRAKYYQKIGSNYMTLKKLR